MALLYESNNCEDGEKIFGRYLSFGNIGFMLASLLSFYMLNISFDISMKATVISHVLYMVLPFVLIDPEKETFESNRPKTDKNSIYSELLSWISDLKSSLNLGSNSTRDNDNHSIYPYIILLISFSFIFTLSR
ncbi:MAG: hypothetical protein LBN09_09280 [Clostridioides sp.]|nr:hypothetical protein [Clostridioides sp.]